MRHKSPRTLARALRAAKVEDIEPIAVGEIGKFNVAKSPLLFAHILARLDRIERELGIGVKRV